jgi:alkaline phosphatase D
VVGSEFVATSISSSFPASQADLVLLTFGVNPHIKYFNGLRRGWLRCQVDRRTWRSEFRGVVDALDPGSATETLASWVVEKDVPGPVEA